MPKRRKYAEGSWMRSWFHGNDSALINYFDNYNTPYLNVTQLSVGEVIEVHAEPENLQCTVGVHFANGGKDTHIAWPGAQVNADSSGAQATTPGSVIGIHGLWEAPLPGQQVLVGYVEGSGFDPIVINKYPYQGNINPIHTPPHEFPLTRLGHSDKDIVLGSFTGSFIALRATTPLPGEIDIFAKTAMNITVESFMIVEVTGDFDLTSRSVTIDSDTTTIELNATTTINLNGTPGVIVNGGSTLVAKTGDLTLTMLGTQPILGTAVDLLVSP